MTIFLTTPPLLEAFLTPISRQDAAFKGFLIEVLVGPIPHLVLFELCCFSEVFQERIYLQLCPRVDKRNKILYAI